MACFRIHDQNFHIGVNSAQICPGIRHHKRACTMTRQLNAGVQRAGKIICNHQ